MSALASDKICRFRLLCRAARFAVLHIDFVPIKTLALSTVRRLFTRTQAVIGNWNSDLDWLRKLVERNLVAHGAHETDCHNWRDGYPLTHNGRFLHR